jgi:hypothetical protein
MTPEEERRVERILLDVDMTFAAESRDRDKRGRLEATIPQIVRERLRPRIAQAVREAEAAMKERCAMAVREYTATVRVQEKQFAGIEIEQLIRALE